MGSTVSCHKTDKKTLDLNDNRKAPSEKNKGVRENTNCVRPNSDLLREIGRGRSNKKKLEALNDHDRIEKLGIAHLPDHAKLDILISNKLETNLFDFDESAEEKVHSELPKNKEVILEESLKMRDTSGDIAQVYDSQGMAKQSVSDTTMSINNAAINNGAMEIDEKQKCSSSIEKETEINTNSETLVPNNADSGLIGSDDSSRISQQGTSDEHINTDTKSNELDKNEQETFVDVQASETSHADAEDDVEAKILANVRDGCLSMKENKWIINDERITTVTMAFLYGLQKSSSNMDVHSKIADILLETNTVDKLCEIVIFIQKKASDSQFNLNQNLIYTIGATLGILVNYTDTSEAVAEKVAGFPGMLDALRQILVDLSDLKLHEANVATEEGQALTCIINNALSVVYNVSLVESNISHLRKLNFTEVLQRFLVSKDKDDHLCALAALACITDEKEAEIINSNRKVVKYLMKVLRHALESSDRRCAGWSCKELAVVIKTLARNDANKKLLVQLGALKLLVKLTKGSTDETIEAVGAIWALSFDGDNRKVMIEDEAVGVIAALTQLRESDSEKIKVPVDGALWNLREDLLASQNDTYKSIGKKIVAQGQAPAKPSSNLRGNSASSTKEGHIMISYQWGNQKVLINIRDELKKHGFKVWMDVDNMAGSTLQAMAEAIENAYLVLLCYSQKYKNSPNCRAEAEYTFQRQKTFLPVCMETGYKPDGWLGILVGTKLFYDFSGKYEFQIKLGQLLKEVRRLDGELHDAGSTIAPEVPRKTEPVYHHAEIQGDSTDSYHGVTRYNSASSVADKVRLWTQDDVRNWITKHHLLENECSDLTADEVALLVEMKAEAPEAFYKTLQKKFNYNLKLISQLVMALKAIDT